MTALGDYNIGGQTLQLEKFDLKKLVVNDSGEFVNPRIAMIAKSGSGKSWVIREILYYLSKTRIPCGTVIAPTDKMTKFYDDIIPATYIHHEYKEEIIPKVMERQTKMLAKNERRINKTSASMER
jgi:ABC-type glutathione transport system ATPase component